MTCGIVDLGSNTIRLSIYQCEGGDIRLLLGKKVTAGLAGYVQAGALSEEGIARACEVLQDYRQIAQNLALDRLEVFATASLRNITNTDEARRVLQLRTGLAVQVLSGEEEATLDFIGATHALEMEDGLLVDIGGGSTELVFYRRRRIENALSIPIGSLSMYTRHVCDLLPSKPERHAIVDEVQSELRRLEKRGELPSRRYPRLCGVGGTIRAAGRLRERLFPLPEPRGQELSVAQLREILRVLRRRACARRLLLQAEPERIHTAIPGMLILRAIARRFGSETIAVSCYGVREGYLYNRVLGLGPKEQGATGER